MEIIMTGYSGKKILAIGDPNLKTRVERVNPQYHLINRIDEKSKKALEEMEWLVRRYAPQGNEEKTKEENRRSL